MITWLSDPSSGCPMHVSGDGAVCIEREFGSHGEWVLKFNSFYSVASWSTKAEAKAVVNNRKRIPFRCSGHIKIFEVG
jgi:hypothetical protein